MRLDGLIISTQNFSLDLLVAPGCVDNDVFPLHTGTTAPRHH